MEITDDEIVHAIKRLKTGKSAGNDDFIGEIFLFNPNFFDPLLKTLFNYMFANGIFPDSWMEGVVIPVYQKVGTLPTRTITARLCVEKNCFKLTAKSNF